MAQQSTISANIVGTIITLQFSSGDEIVLDGAHLSRELQTVALMHGIKQKLVDAAAISRNTETGKPATPQDKYEAVAKVAERLRSGMWNANREGTGGSTGLLVAALMRIKSLDRETVEAWLEKKTKEEQAALRANPAIAPVIAEIKAEREAANPKVKSIDTNAMLDDLG